MSTRRQIWTPGSTPGPRRPLLRPLEVHPAGDDRILLSDPSRLTPETLVLNRMQVLLFSLMDGDHTIEEIARDASEILGVRMPVEVVADAVAQLDELGLLAGPSFEAFYQRKADAYRASSYRSMPYLESYPAAGERLRTYMNEGMDAQRGLLRPAGRVRGLIAPHLDYPRGLPCYASAYAQLRDRLKGAEKPPERVVILGTNHFGRSSSVVGTTQSFETPWGVIQNDRESSRGWAPSAAAISFPTSWITRPSTPSSSRLRGFTTCSGMACALRPSSVRSRSDRRAQVPAIPAASICGSSRWRWEK